MMIHVYISYQYIKLPAQLLVIGTKIGYSFIHGYQQFEIILDRYPVHLNKVFRMILGSGGNSGKGSFLWAVIFEPQLWYYGINFLLVLTELKLSEEIPENNKTNDDIASNFLIIWLEFG